MAKARDIDLVLIRVGSTAWDDAERVSGSCDLPLSERGLEQMRALAAKTGADHPLGVTLCGCDEASRQTAELFCEKLGGRVRSLEDLNGVSLGLWEGLRIQELDEKFPTAARQWREDPSSVTPPSGESLAEAQDRLLTELVRTIEKCKCEGGTGIGIALRPIAFSILLSTIDDRPLNDLWSVQVEAEEVVHRRVTREQVRSWRDRVRQPAAR